ncbi:Larval cuticle protein LCP-22 [Orchesella cincta]|uniref:Larval cuticle protein LCP-22 n=1 Tax=Orchesella cincta TaxID=48709 RepID=A0A1D2N8G0_ORCCI|nr:Larval cuticle protein LCP-22 [Orchesella cincta]
MMGRLILCIALFVSVILVADTQRQRNRGQYGRRVADGTGTQLVEETQPAVAILEKEPERPKIYETHREIAPNLGDGKFQYYSATSDGLESEQFGHFNNPLDSQVHQGSYTTKDEFGRVVKVDYIADKDGFRPIGPHGASALPVAPPVPLEHAKAREDILSLQKAIREQHLGYLRAGYAAHGR